MGVSEVAGDMLEESAGEAAQQASEGVGVPGIDLTHHLKKMALSTSPNPPIPNVIEEQGTDRGGAYLYRAFRKALSAIPGIGDGPNPAILDGALGVFHKATGSKAEIPLSRGSDEEEADEGPDPVGGDFTDV